MRILIIDDEVDLGELLETRLARLGHTCERATNGLEALGLLEERKDAFSCVFTDLNMPKMNGLLFCAEFKKRWPYTPVVLMSGTHVVDDLSLTEFTAAGFFAFLGKPFPVTALVQILDEIDTNKKHKSP